MSVLSKFKNFFNFFSLSYELSLDDKNETSNFFKTFISKVSTIISQSVRDKNNVVSSTRIQGYLIIIIIYLFALMTIAIQIVNIISTWPAPYTIPTEFILILSLILTHHLGILFNKIRENKFDTTNEMSNLKQQLTDFKSGKITSTVDNSIDDNIQDDNNTTTQDDSQQNLDDTTSKNR